MKPGMSKESSLVVLSGVVAEAPMAKVQISTKVAIVDRLELVRCLMGSPFLGLASSWRRGKDVRLKIWDVQLREIAGNDHYSRPMSAVTTVPLERALTTSGCRVGL